MSAGTGDRSRKGPLGLGVGKATSRSPRSSGVPGAMAAIQAGADTVLLSEDSDGPSAPARGQRVGMTGGSNGARPYGAGMGMGMGMGMGVGMGGPMGYGGYGMGMGMGMYGNPMMSMLMGPMNFMYTINYSILAIGQVCEMVGASSTGLVQLAQSTLRSLRALEASVRQSAFRQWLQRKSRRSKLFRFVCVLLSMVISFHASRLVQQLLGGQLGRFLGGRGTSPSPTSLALAAPTVTLNSAATTVAPSI